MYGVLLATASGVDDEAWAGATVTEEVVSSAPEQAHPAQLQPYTPSKTSHDSALLMATQWSQLYMKHTDTQPVLVSGVVAADTAPVVATMSVASTRDLVEGTATAVNDVRASTPRPVVSAELTAPLRGNDVSLAALIVVIGGVAGS